MGAPPWTRSPNKEQYTQTRINLQRYGKSALSDKCSITACFGRSVIHALGVTAFPPGAVRWKRETIDANASTASVSAKCWPMQTRGPMPNGIYVNGFGGG